jgi:hypothetical protein
MLPSSRMTSRPQRPQPFLLQPNLILASTAMAEFMGTMLLQLLAGSTSSPARAAAAYAGLSKHQTGNAASAETGTRSSCALVLFPALQ